MESCNPFARSEQQPPGVQRRDMIISGAIHGGILLLLVLAGLFFRGENTIPMGGGEFVTVEMIVLDQGDTPSEAVEEAVEETPVEETPVEEVIEEPVEEIEEPVEEIDEPVEEVTEPVEEVEQPVEEVEVASSQEFISVGSQGEAGSGAPGPASYEGRVFSAIRRNFRTSVNPPQSYRITYTVNLDGSTSYQVIRNSGDSGFDRAVTHALNSASIPPMPPGRTQPVQLSIEFLGPDTQ